MNSLFVKFTVVLISKLVSAFSGLIVTLVVTNKLPIDSSGYFLFFISLVFVLSIISRQGFDNLILRDFSTEHKVSNYSLLSRSIYRVFLLCFLFLISYMIILPIFKQFYYYESEYFIVLKYAFVSLIPLSIANLLSFIFQANQNFVLSSFFQTSAVNIIFLLLLHLNSNNYTLSFFLYLYMLSCYIAFFLSFIFLIKKIPKIKSVKLKVSLGLFLNKSQKAFFENAIANLTIQWGTYLISVFYITASEMAVLSASNRFAFVLGFILTIINTVAIPYIVKYSKSCDYYSLKIVSKVFTMFSYLVTLPISVSFIYFSGDLLDFFGQDYGDYPLVFVILLFGQLVNVLTGSVGYLLNLSGHEKTVRFISFITAILTLLLSFPVIYFFGLYGACAIICFSLSFQNLVLFCLVKKHLGFWLVPKLSKIELVYFWRLISER